MDKKTLHTLEFDKILERLAEYTEFSVSAEKAHAIMPTANANQARKWQAETREARHLLSVNPALSIGGARDIRDSIKLALHAGVLTTQELLDIKSTLIAARTLARTFERLEVQYPHLAEIASQIQTAAGLIEAISRSVSDRGDILDSASPKLSNIRKELLITHEKLFGKLQHMLHDPNVSAYLQEMLITQRDGRYVIPLRADFKGRIKSIVHDQSSSGATLFVEPIGVVELNNQNRELQLQERDEERRIQLDLSNQVASHADMLTDSLQVIADLDLIFARAKFAEALGSTEPQLYDFPKSKVKTSTTISNHPGSQIKLYQARHPLLDPNQVVPIDVELDDSTYALVITGPNTGGKTVTLKTVGLLVLMALSGFQIPAQAGSGISAFTNVYADIGDEQSIEQSLSTFSGHITNIIRILAHANSRCLVILDELGAGTDPQEGAALARSLLIHQLEHGITTLVTTHHPELKAFAHATPGVANASVEFDLETLRPTFHLTIGLPGRSNALAIAERLGMPEAIISNARAELNPQDLKADDLLDEIYRQRDHARQSRAIAEKMEHEAQETRSKLVEQLGNIERERHIILADARSEAQSELDQIQSEIRDLRKELLRKRQPIEPIKPLQEVVEQLEKSLERSIEIEIPETRLISKQKTIALGDRVRLKSLNTIGIVSALDDQEAEVQVGNLRIRSRIDDMEYIENVPPIETTMPSITYKTPYDIVSPGWELNLRGQRTDEALQSLEKYLDAAFLAGLPFVRIIHGKGTGKLREAIRRAMSRHPYVSSYEAGGEKEGGEGVTIAKIKIH